MKKLLLCAVVLCGMVQATAQELMKVQLTDGSVIEYDVSAVARVYFEKPITKGEAVDLGLTVLWATYNVGAESPEQIGDYFAWGEPETKSLFETTNYNFSTIYDDIAGTELDAAHMQWGNGWRMPNKGEALELVERCTWTPKTQNGVAGYQVTGPNGNSIFLPASGYYGSTYLNHSETCNYWTSNVVSGNTAVAWNLYCQSTGPSVIYWYNTSLNNRGRFWGMPIRPVLPKYSQKTGGEDASEDNPVDMTYAINSPSYDDDHYYGWAGTDPTNCSYNCFEQWNKNFDNYQTINGLPEGYYKLTVQGYYRHGYSYNDYEYYTNGQPSEVDYAVIYATSSVDAATKPLVYESSAALQTALGGTTAAVGSGLFIPNNMLAASKWFEAGYYQNELSIRVGADGNLTIGFKKDQTIEGDWVIVDNWKLTYYGHISSEKNALKLVTGEATNITAHSATLEAGWEYPTQYVERNGHIVEAELPVRFLGVTVSKNPTFKSGTGIYISGDIIIYGTGSCAFEIENLESETTYYYRTIVQNGISIEGGTSSVFYADYDSEIKSFTTLPAETPSVLYAEPLITWNSTPTQVKSYMSGYNLQKEDTQTLVYEGKYKELGTVYWFDQNLLYNSYVAFSSSDVTLEELDAQIQQNYILVLDLSDTKLYMSADGLTDVFLSEQDDMYFVDYYSDEYLNRPQPYFEDPYLIWNAPRATVKRAMANLGYTLYSESDLASEYFEQMYVGKNQEFMQTYSFNPTTETLFYVSLAFSDVDLDDLKAFATEEMGYEFVGKDGDGDDVYLTTDKFSYVYIYEKTFSNGSTYQFVDYSSATSNAKERVKQRSSLPPSNQISSVRRKNLIKKAQSIQSARVKIPIK